MHKYDKTSYSSSELVDAAVYNNLKTELYHSFSDEDISVLKHHGILGMKWGVRRYQNEDGSLTEEGKRRYYNKNKTGISIDGARRLSTIMNSKEYNPNDKETNKYINNMLDSLFTQDEKNKIQSKYDTWFNIVRGKDSYEYSDEYKQALNEAGKKARDEINTNPYYSYLKDESDTVLLNNKDYNEILEYILYEDDLYDKYRDKWIKNELNGVDPDTLFDDYYDYLKDTLHKKLGDFGDQPFGKWSNVTEELMRSMISRKK